VKNWSRILNYFRPELPKVFLAAVLMLLSIAANLLKPWPLALIIDHVLSGKPAPEWLPSPLAHLSAPALLGLAALMILLLHCAQGAFSAGQNYISIRAGLSGLARIRKQLFDWMQRLSLAFYQSRNQGDLIYRATWDTYSLQTIFQQGIFKFLSALATVVLMLVVMWRVSAPLTLITLGVFPPLLASIYFFGRRMNARSLAAHRADGNIASLVQQNITSLPIIQSSVRESRESTVFAGKVDEALEARLAQHPLEVIYWLVIAAVFGIGTAGLTWCGAREILAQHLTVGELIIFLSYLGQIYEPLNQLSNVGATVADANAGLHRIFEILDSNERICTGVSVVPFPDHRRGGAGIRFENVSFSYVADRPVLKGVTLDIGAGERIGLVGPSGAGKTTLLNLIPRFYEATSGAITINGINLQKLATDDLREHIAYVFQESLLLPGSIADNIAFARPNASREQVIEAARMADAHDFITRLSNGYDTQVGEGAARLSVGEKQRINIARAFLKNAPILLLDEPTSALDAETEASIVKTLGRLVENRTTIMAAHRFATLQQARRIIVIENGAITETGSPADLLARNGYYAKLAQSQRLLQEH
jgi:ATP-binding cassette subfamily B protein/subfamily B ATP-binding cassette protein MsbA